MNLSVSYVNKAFDRCKAKAGSIGSVSVRGMRGVSYTLHLNTLKEEFTPLLSLIRRFPERMFASRNPFGAPWIMICAQGSGYEGCTQETADRLVAMGIALDIIRIVGHDAVATDIPVILVDDLRLMREEKLTKKGFVYSQRAKRVLHKKNCITI